MEKLALSVELPEVIEEAEKFLQKGRAILFIGQTDYQYAKAINMKSGSFNGFAMYAGFKNKTLKQIKKYFDRKYCGIISDSGKGWLKLYVEL